MDYWNGMWPIYSLRLYIKDKLGLKKKEKPKEKDKGKKDSLP